MRAHMIKWCMPIPLSPSPQTLTAALAVIKRDWTDEYNDFTNGDCHTLAVALYQAMGYQGKLCACLRETFDENALPFSTGYSHMVYEAPDGLLWDINGMNADVRWEDDLALPEEPDEDGLVHTLRWVDVPYDTYQVWLQDHYGAIDNGLTDKLTVALRQELQTDVLSCVPEM